MTHVGLDYLSLDRHRGQPVRRRGAAHPPGDADRLEPGRRALHSRRAVDRLAPARQPAPAGDVEAAARSRQHRARRRARSRRHPRRRLRHRHGPGRRRARRLHRRPRDAGADHGRSQFAHREVSVRDRGNPRPAAPPSGQRLDAEGQGRAAEQSAERHRGYSARHDHLRDRRVRIRQELAGHRHALSRPGAAAVRVEGEARRARRRSPAGSCSTKSSTSTRRRSAAPRARTRRPTPACLRISATCSRSCPRRACAATGRDAFRST